MPLRWLVLGLVALVVVAGAIVWGLSSSSTRHPEQEFIAAQREAGLTEPSDAVMLQTLNNACDSGDSIDSLLTKDPRYLPKSITREQYVGLAEEYCASRR